MSTRKVHSKEEVKQSYYKPVFDGSAWPSG